MNMFFFKRLCLSFVAFLSVGMLVASPIVNINGSDVENAISQITFDGDYAVLHFQNGVSQNEDMENVVVRFSPETGASLNLNKVFDCSTAVDNELFIKGVSANTSLRIVDALGHIKKQIVTVEGDNRISVEDLSAGVYLLLVDDVVVKFVKK